MTDLGGPPLPPLIGTRLGDYLVESVVGRGGMATVYRAHDHRLNRAVALKVLAPQLSHDPRFRDRFIRESRLVASIDHPHIIPIYEAGESNELLFIAMRYVDGSDLRKLIQSGGPLPIARAGRLFTQIASALDAAHLNGLVHRDVKPANILVAEGPASDPEADHVYLTDFGLTKSTYAEAGLTSQGQFMGTPRYVAPEQIRGLPVDGRGDLYAFACVVYEALTGLPPFQRDTELALLYAHVSHEPPPLTPYRPELPHAVNAVMARALAKSPTERYATCQQFITALRDAIAGGPGTAGVAPEIGTTSTPPVPSPPEPVAGLAPGPVSGPFPGPISGPISGPVTGANTWPPGGAGPHSHPGQGMSSLPPGAAWTQPAAEYRPRQARRKGVPKGPLIGIAAALVSLAVVALVLFNPGGQSPVTWHTFSGNLAAPFTFSHPAEWSTRVHGDEYVIISPSAAEFETLFSVPLVSDWTTVNRIINSEDPGRAAGILAQVNNTLDVSDVQHLKDTLPAVLPGPVGFGSEPTAATVGGRPGFRVTGTINDPQQGGRLDFVAYLVRRAQGQPTALITFFCAPGRCDNSMIDRVVGSVAFQ
ncbi:serine/threonine-protein kinase [Thermopolyspora sp. NPDC052614]|uniref:serine/threonine-protein kinase n=1 Tax=Thermopolyspora sp. NPDC052614 TaxID=3155682 RepID=UPI003422184D